MVVAVVVAVPVSLEKRGKKEKGESVCFSIRAPKAIAKTQCLERKAMGKGK